MSRFFRHYDMNQPMLLQTDAREWVPDDHLALFISDIIESMNLIEIYDSYKMKAGKPAYDPKLLLKLLVYGYSNGVRSSRRIEKATYENIAFRVLSANTHPDHDTISEFRKRHFRAFSSVFTEVLELCKKAKLLKCNHISLDGTKIKGNAKKSKSRKYPKLLKTKKELQMEVDQIIQEAEEIDEAEDKKYGKGNKGNPMPPELKDKKKRKALIEKLLGEIEKEAEQVKADYPKKKAKMKKEDDDWMKKTGTKFERRPPKNPTNKSVEEIVPARRNPTDYDSRIMKEGISGGYIQGYNCQAAVLAGSQIIVAADVYNQPNDKCLSRPMMDKANENLGEIPTHFTADNGYFSERDIIALEEMGLDPYIPPTKKTKGKRYRGPGQAKNLTEEMRDKLESESGKAIYSKRKTIAEPVFGQIKEARGFRSFLLRGLEKVKAEWQLITLAHNIGKLHRLRV